MKAQMEPPKTDKTQSLSAGSLSFSEENIKSANNVNCLITVSSGIWIFYMFDNLTTNKLAFKSQSI